MVAQVRAEAVTTALLLSVAIEIGRPGDDRERKATPVVAYASPVPSRSMRRSRGFFATILVIDANHLRHRTSRAAATSREDRRRATTGSRPRVDGRRRQNSIHPKSRPRLSNVLPFTGEALDGKWIIHWRPSPP